MATGDADHHPWGRERSIQHGPYRSFQLFLDRPGKLSLIDHSSISPKSQALRVSVCACCTRSVLHSYGSQHAAIDVLHYMAMKRKCANNAWITKIHAQDQTGEFAKPIPGGQIHRVSQRGFFPPHGSPANHNEVQLMNMKNVRFARTVFDCPIFDISLSNCDRWLGILRIENGWLVAFLSNKEQGRAVGIRRVDQPFRKIKRALPCWPNGR